MSRKVLLVCINVLISSGAAYLVSGLLILLFQYVLSGGEAPENITWTGLYVLSGLITLMYVSVGILIASISTSFLKDGLPANIVSSLITGTGAAVIFTVSLVVIPVRHEKLQVVLAGVAAMVGGLLYLDYLLKQQRRQKTENSEQKEEDCKELD